MNNLIYISKTGIANVLDSTDPPPDKREVEAAERWVRVFAQPQEKTNTRVDSYQLKHFAERWAGTYISNGAFIAASVNLGYRIETIPRSTTCYFNMKFRNKPRRLLVNVLDPYMPWEEE